VAGFTFGLGLVTTTRFAKDRKRARKRGLDLSLLDAVLEALADRRDLPPRHRDHSLTGAYEGFRECHIQPDWLLIYMVDEADLILVASRTGTHSDLF
jgi:mRNA interferase YafQ